MIFLPYLPLGTPEQPKNMRRSNPLLKSLFLCGIISSLLYVLVDIIAARAAIGTLYNLLVIAFAAGIWISPAPTVQKRILRIVSVLMLSHAVSGFIGGTVFPMYALGVAAVITEVLFMLLVIGFGALAFGSRFRLYSIATIVLSLAAGGLSAAYGTRVAAGLPAPGLQIVERINIYGFMLWVIVLAVMFLKRKKAHPVAERMHYIMRVL